MIRRIESKQGPLFCSWVPLPKQGWNKGDCPKCQGSGAISSSYMSLIYGKVESYTPCPDCSSQVILDNSTNCQAILDSPTTGEK